MENQKAINVQVAVRCRPPNAEERKSNVPSVVQCETESKQIKVSYGAGAKKMGKTFSFDKVFGMYSTQDQIFDSMVRPIIDETLSGFNCTIFAYGQTGTGKTHTMEGNINVPEDAGIVPRSAKAIIEQLEASGAEFTIRVSFLELYNEELQDLLAEGSGGNGPLRLCEDNKKGGVVCQNLEEISVMTHSDIFEILQKGIKRRQTAETLMNKNSSRSHSIFTLKIMIKEMNIDGEDVVRHGQLNLVDLAGSECVGRSGAKNDRAREAGSINQSLLTLGRVITALVDHHGHIPYRDSKLTRLLQESLGGKAKTCIIATLSPSQLAVEESLSTLDYAHRAKNIKNRPEVNQKMTKKAVLKEYGAEIENLRLMLQATRDKNGIYLDPSQFEAMEARLQSQESQLLECEGALKGRMEELKQLRGEREEMENKIATAQASLEEATGQLDDVTKVLEETTENLMFTQVELAASDAVVGEQCVTETGLTDIGTDFVSRITGHRSDINLLHDKIDRHSSMEVQRIDEADSFQNEVVTLQNILIKEVTGMKKSNKSESQALCAGVGDLLDRGKDTCSSLQVAIDGALGVLVADAGASRDKMTASCDALQLDLQAMGSSASESLVALKGKLGDWIMDLEAGMGDVIAHMNSQQEEIQKLTSEVQNARAEQKEQLKHLSTQQQGMTAKATTKIEDNGNSISENIRIFNSQHQQGTEAQEEFVKNKTNEIEMAVAKMMKEFRSSMAGMMSQSAAQTNDFCVSMKKGQVDADHELMEVVNENNALVENSVAALENASSKAADMTVVSLEAIENSCQGTQDSMLELTNSVPEKKMLLNDTTTSVVENVQSTVARGCESVADTSDIAKAILTSVQEATNDMNKSTTSSLESFTEFMDGAGSTLKNELGSHFEVLDVFLAHQEQVSCNTIEEAAKFKVASTESVVVSTGQTPRKAPFTPLRELISTRDHDDIKAEIRAARKRKAEEAAEEEAVVVNSDSIDDEEASLKSNPPSDSTPRADENANPQGDAAASESLAPVATKRPTRASKLQRPEKDNS